MCYRNRIPAVSVLLYYSSRIVRFLYQLCSPEQQRVYYRRKKHKGHGKYKSPQYSLGAWNSFSVPGHNSSVSRAVSFHSLQIKSNTFRFTQKFIWNLYKLTGFAFFNLLFMRTTSYTMSSLQQKHSSQIFITLLGIKVINTTTGESFHFPYWNARNFWVLCRIFMGLYLCHEYISKAFSYMERYWPLSGILSSFGSHYNVLQ